MNDLNYFTALIQLISAVNFANIKLSFHKKIFELVVDTNSMYKAKFDKVQNAISADFVSIEALKPIETKDNKSNALHIQDLKEKYSELKKNWEKKYSSIQERFEKCKSQRGIKSFFLFISLYCIFDLALIAYIQSYPDKYIFQLILNLLSIITLIISLGYIYKIVRQNYSADDSKLYKITLILSFISIISAVAFAFALIKYGAIRNFISQYEEFLFSAAIILPFLPCICCFIIYAFQEIILQLITFISTFFLIKEQQKLHNKKTDLDKMYTIFQDISGVEEKIGYN